MSITNQQAERLQVKAGSQISPMLERCCLRVSANVPYQRTRDRMYRLKNCQSLDLVK